ncbi:MAG: hypothetical protein SGJ20_03085 [Planctomycetota bacterium]|nr:hypothetical protein [Planctomycetota bacterium]
MSLDSNSQTLRPVQYRRFERWFGAAAILGGSLLAVNRWMEPSSVLLPVTTAISVPSDEQHGENVIGVWRDYYEGTRTLTVRDDGTATMIVELEGWKAKMFTPRLQIETTWTINEGRFDRTIVGGKPADKVNFVKNRVGATASDKIVNLSPNRMILVDQDGSTRYDWKRLK